MTAELNEIKTSLEAARNGLHVTIYPHGNVVNINRHVGDLERADVDAARAQFAELGYAVTEEWLPVVGLSWLSNGVSAGVSFRVKEKEEK